MTAVKTYEGWTNEPTWYLNLTIDNDSTTWKAKAAFMKCATTKVPGLDPVRPMETAVRAFCESLAASGHIDKKLLVDVNWPELTNDWLIFSRELH
jgi:hypothetical protein